MEPILNDTDLWANRMEKMCFRFLSEIPLSFLIKYVEMLGGRVILGGIEIQHCDGCIGFLDNGAGNETPCPGVEL